jgi:hypothetical protein
MVSLRTFTINLLDDGYESCSSLDLQCQTEQTLTAQVESPKLRSDPSGHRLNSELSNGHWVNVIRDHAPGAVTRRSLGSVSFSSNREAPLQSGPRTRPKTFWGRGANVSSAPACQPTASVPTHNTLKIATATATREKNQSSITYLFASPVSAPTLQDPSAV